MSEDLVDAFAFAFAFADTDRYWANYNEALTKITDEGKCDGVVIAKGCGHFIQTDNPSFVAEEVTKMLRKLSW